MTRLREHSPDIPAASTEPVRTPTVRNFIGGAPSPAPADAYTVLIDPSTGDEAGLAPNSGPAEVDAAVAAARTAATEWGRSTPADRALALLRIAEDLEREAESFADLECANTGKPRQATLDEEIAPAIDQLRFFAGAARTLGAPAAGEYLAGHLSTVRREPVGVCAQITPWNYPLLMAVWKIGPAVATGNTVVVKPAETTPLTTVRLAALAARHLPAGTVNALCGDRRTGALLAAHDDVAMVSLTGSVRAGRQVAATAGPALKRLHLELGGNCAALVFPDTDLDAAATAIAEAGFFNAGQDCVAASRVLVHERVRDEFTALLVERARNTRTGPTADPEAFYGPLNNADQLARLQHLFDRLPAHAEVRTGGHRVGSAGFFFAPTVVAGLRPADELVREETFGPVLTVQGFADLDEAAALANDVPQGLAASVWSEDRRTAARLSRELEVGCVWLNTHLRFAAEMPHGGVKDSGYGKDLSAFAVQEYTTVKHIMEAY